MIKISQRLKNFIENLKEDVYFENSFGDQVKCEYLNSGSKNLQYHIPKYALKIIEKLKMTFEIS